MVGFCGGSGRLLGGWSWDVAGQQFAVYNFELLEMPQVQDPSLCVRRSRPKDAFSLWLLLTVVCPWEEDGDKD